MIWPFKKQAKSFLGIDIGASVIKIVELTRHGEQEKLENYACVSILASEENSQRQIKKDSLLLSPREISEILNLMSKEAGVKTGQAFFAVSDLSTFFTTFSLPQMSKEEIEQAIQFEARRHVPLPLSEVTLGWKIIRGKLANVKKGEVEVLLVVVPNTAIDQYASVAEFSKLELLSLEAEVFGLARALAREPNQTVALIDIGARSTTCSIVDNQALKVSHSFDTAGNSLTERIAASQSIDWETAEALKREQGLLRKKESGAREIVLPIIDVIVSEIKKVVDGFYQEEGKEIQQYILAGGTALLPGLREYLTGSLRKEVNFAQPFAKMAYPPILEETLNEIGPLFAIAAGMALKGLE